MNAPSLPAPDEIRLLALLDLGRAARRASGSEELGFLLVNDTRAIAPYRQAALWFEKGGVARLSGVIDAETNAPYVQWLDRVCAGLSHADRPGPFRVRAADLPPELAAEWGEWLPQHALWLPLAASSAHGGSSGGGLLLAGDDPVDDATLVVLAEWLDTWRHAWLAALRPPLWSRQRWQRGGDGRAGAARAWWRRTPVRVAAIALAAMAIPVRLTVLAPGELVPAKPAVIRAPLDGVIGSFEVRPNEIVKAGQPLFTFDEAQIGSRLTVARQALATAQAEYRQAAQLALTDPKSKAQLATIAGKIGEKRAEAEFLAGQYKRSQVSAPREGIALFDDPSEWIGRPVQTGERILRIADPHEVEVEAWVPVGDAIPLAEDAEVRLYLAAEPFSPVAAKLRYLNHDAVPRPDGVYAYRARAILLEPTAHRIGLKGTAKLYGRWVPLGYWMLRAPLARVRQLLAM